MLLDAARRNPAMGMTIEQVESSKWGSPDLRRKTPRGAMRCLTCCAIAGGGAWCLDGVYWLRCFRDGVYFITFSQGWIWTQEQY